MKYCNECGSRVIGVKVLRWDEGFVRYLEGISISIKYMEDDWRGEGLMGNVGFHSKDIVSLIDPYYFDRGKLGNFYWGKEIMMINDEKDNNGRRIGMNELSIGEIEKEAELVREQIRRMGITDEEKWRVNVYMKILTGG